MKTPTLTRGPLTYFAAPSIVLALRTPFARVKLCRVGFGGDGSIYVMFPYLNRKNGILSDLALPESGPGPVTYNLAANGIEVDQDVKFSHHASGVALFSKTGMSQKLPRRQSFPLSDGTGIIFWLFAYRFSGFTWFEKQKKKDTAVFYQFADKHPSGIKLEAEWVPISSITSKSIHRNGPVGTALNVRNGTSKSAVYFGQPPGSPFPDHVLVITAHEQEAPDGADSPTMVFVGGFDDIRHAPRSSGCLSFLYPSGRDAGQPA